MFFEAFLPVALGTTDIANVAVHVYLYITCKSSAAGSLSLNVKNEESLLEVLKTNFNLQKGRICLNARVSSFLTVHEVEPRKGSIITTSFFGTDHRPC